MYNLDVYNALTDALAAHQSVVKYSKDVVAALEEKLEEAKATLEREEVVHHEIRHARRRFSPNAIDRIVADRIDRRSANGDEEDTEGSLAVLKVLNIVE